MNRVIKKWKTRGISFCGFVHSHPPGYCRLSGHDQWYAGEILEAFKRLDALVLPIVQTVPDTGTFRMLPFVAVPETNNRRSCTVVEAELCVVAEDINEHALTKRSNCQNTSTPELVVSSIPLPHTVAVHGFPSMEQ
jgi:hypothetical protein